METAFTEKEGYDNFRVSRPTFDYFFYSSVKQSRERSISVFSAEYRTIANLFGVSTSFVCLCIRDVCKTITKKLKNDFLKLPKGEDLREVMRLYKEKWGFPSCAGAIDGTHISIQAPLENRTDYINRKSYHSIVMQALVDSKYLFRDVVIGWPGSVHDARVLSNSELYNRGCNGQSFDPRMKE